MLSRAGHWDISCGLMGGHICSTVFAAFRIYFNFGREACFLISIIAYSLSLLDPCMLS